MRLPIKEDPSSGDFLCAVCSSVLAYEGDDEFSKDLRDILNGAQDKHQQDCPVKNLKR